MNLLEWRDYTKFKELFLGTTFSNLHEQFRAMVKDGTTQCTNQPPFIWRAIFGLGIYMGSEGFASPSFLSKDGI